MSPFMVSWGGPGRPTCRSRHRRKQPGRPLTRDRRLTRTALLWYPVAAGLFASAGPSPWMLLRRRAFSTLHYTSIAEQVSNAGESPGAKRSGWLTPDKTHVGSLPRVCPLRSRPTLCLAKITADESVRQEQGAQSSALRRGSAFSPSTQIPLPGNGRQS